MIFTVHALPTGHSDKRAIFTIDQTTAVDFTNSGNLDAETVWSTADGYHIVYFVSVEEPGEADFDKYKDVIAENIKESNADEEWEKIKKEWCSAEEVMIDYEAIKAINKSDAAAA